MVPLHLDFAGLVIPLKSTTTTMLIGSLRHMFLNHGLPETIVTDNGAQFSSAPSKTFFGVTISPTPTLHHLIFNQVGENSWRSTMPYFQRTKSPLVHLHAPRRPLHPAQQFTCMIIGRIIHGQKVTSEFDKVACYAKWKSMTKLGCVIGTTSFSSTQQDHRNWKPTI
ncbi:hypothetical protein ACTXT7_005182 [Hymenolepis weldensis]